MATAKKAKTATKVKASGKSTKVIKAVKVKKAVKVVKVVKKKVAPKVIAKAKSAPKNAKAVAKSKAAPKPAANARSKTKPAAKAVKGDKITKGAKITKTAANAKAANVKASPKTSAKAVTKKPVKAPPKVIQKTKPAPIKTPPPKVSATKVTAKPAPAKEAAPAKPLSKSTKAPVSVPAALERPKTPVGKQSGRAAVVAAAPPPQAAAIIAPTRALPKSMTVKAFHSNVLPFNPKTKGVDGYLSEAEILKQPKDKYMSKEQLAFFKQRLLELQSQLRENAGQTTEHLRELSIVPDPADRATLEEEHALELRARDRERKLLKKVEASIVSIAEGSYGYCEETGEPIGIPRLLARPTATLTIEAQERRELKQRMFGE